MTLEEIDLPAGHTAVRLTTDDLAVTILPDKGCDVFAVVDARTGMDVLFKTPWGLQSREGGARPPDSQGHWLRLYPGGWQVLLPNAGAETPEHGTAWGFHGEASLARWEYERVGESGLHAGTRLFYAPLTLTRRMDVDGPALRITETVENDSPDPIELMWGHHPAFGAPFLAKGCLLSVPAATYTADDDDPGTMLEPGSTHAWPVATLADGSAVDLSVVPGPDEPRAHLGYLTDLSEHFFAVTNPRAGLGAAVRWTTGVLDQAWFWQEIHSTAGFPWFRRAYVTAIEPHSTIPGQGLAAARAKGHGGFVLPGRNSATVEIELRLFEGNGYVKGVTDDGRVVESDHPG